MKFFQIVRVSITAAISVATTASMANAESLAGKVGDKRFPVGVMGTLGGCQKTYNKYIAAAGHSAYAQTLLGRTDEFFICGSHLNAKSQQAAEAQALKNCEEARKYYKVKVTGACSIAASK
ncbi:MAG TPA: hypothetical protein VGV39_09240 [Mesorhizobium sp.]|jgi:hypothetical protein|uniref:hypothetical protein n=1 Tax=Mesorhizobium sp. TaxID=1871066 RepID=UPI002DDD38D4|nr:hypothetical protein [Mesorhizobium sp.]HEV2503249.1 hypothetical protein [Mesorhizobium sp.]